jgi:REP element-mobilizing transposase RayT
MPRPLRIHAPGAFYHVTVRGNHRQNIFFRPADRQILNEIVAEVIDRFGARVHAYCWMTNHIHALIQVADTPLGMIMLRIASRYARKVQATLHTTGHLFEKRYHPILVDEDAYLLQLLRYIHLNPVRACMVRSPDLYPWSSHLVYLGRREESWVTTSFALAMFHSDRQQAVRAYHRFLLRDLSTTTPSPFGECNANDRRILGSDDFASRLLGQSWQPRSRKTLEDLVTEACAVFRIASEQLYSPSRRHELVKARAWVGHQALTQHIATLAAVARHFRRDESSLRHGVKQHFNYP